jgi:Rps23 Pro-64 3,4-dihydroxylase Tpa1-like proline 4-hydroxylase
MLESEVIALANLKFNNSPFPHFSSSAMFREGLENKIFNWLQVTDEWKFTQADFYTQYEICLLNMPLPDELQFLVSNHTVAVLTKKLNSLFEKQSLKLVDVTAHKLIDGHRMGVHNDLIGPDETHRLIVQINPNWQPENGGFLMFFNSEKPDDVFAIIKPLNNSAVGFEISDHSYHAVSTVHNYNRYTIVYTFNLK